MIRLDRVELFNWDLQPHQVIPLARTVTLLTGENGSGKTSILDAIKVCLGVRALEGDRNVETYLLKQARKTAMVRIVVGNQLDPKTRRRPFDQLGSFSANLVTLAVVFHAEDETRYQRYYYLLDGDVVPPLDNVRKEPRPLQNATDYRARLEKVGLTARYLRLLAMPQGQIASFCKRSPTDLFDDLYDVIGGRQAFDNWESRRKELVELQQKYEAARADWQSADISLRNLEERVNRHHAYVEEERRRRIFEATLPHQEIAEVKDRKTRIQEQLTRTTEDLQRAHERQKSADLRYRTAHNALHRLEDELSGLVEQQQARQAERDGLVHLQATLRARGTTLGAAARKAEGIVWKDLQPLAERREDLLANLGQLRLSSKQRNDKRQDLLATRKQLDSGILPIPDDVRAFQNHLNGAGIAHHLLANIVEIAPEASEWQAAIEGYLGRYRFAIVVADMNTWSQAAALARMHQYPHGILAPDVRGKSAADEESIFRWLIVRDPDLHSLVARIVRTVMNGEPQIPLEPIQKGEILAKDGFVLSKLEARHVAPGDLHLGQEARRLQKVKIDEALVLLKSQEAESKENESAARIELASTEGEIENQRALREWERLRDEAGEVARELAVVEEQLVARKEALDACSTLMQTNHRRQKDLLQQKTSADQETKSNGDEIERRSKERDRLEKDSAEAIALLLKLEEQPLPERTAEVDEQLKLGRSAEALQTRLESLVEGLAKYSATDRDSLLPMNYRRRQTEVTAVKERLEDLAGSLQDTQKAVERARHDYQLATRVVFQHYFKRLAKDAEALDFKVIGEIVPTENGRFRCEIRAGVGDKAPVHYTSPELSGGQKAALSILMAMTAVSLETDGAGFFLVDEPFSASDVYKINELGMFLGRTGAQYLVSMPTSADIAQCGKWLKGMWTTTKSRGGFDARGKPVLALPVKYGFAPAAQDV